MTAPPEALDPEATALFLDIDGTLVELAEHPDAVTVDESLPAVLDEVQAALGGALALISGRGLDDIDRLFGTNRYAAAGAHGSELRYADGSRRDPPGDSLPEALRRRIDEFAATHEGLLVEHKSTGLSLHYRAAPEAESEARAFLDGLLTEIDDEFRLIDGKKVLEVGPTGHSKGDAIGRFLDAAPFAGRRPVFAGDDVTDEDGFRAVIAAGGVAILIGDRAESLAEYRLPDVAAVHRWIAEAFGARIGQ